MPSYLGSIVVFSSALPSGLLPLSFPTKILHEISLPYLQRTPPILSAMMFVVIAWHVEGLRVALCIKNTRIFKFHNAFRRHVIETTSVMTEFSS